MDLSLFQTHVLHGLRAATYVRTSNCNVCGIEQQTRVVLSFCQRQHLAVACSFVDSSQAATGDPGPALSELIKRIRDEEFLIDCVVVASLSRLTREPLVLRKYEALFSRRCVAVVPVHA